MFRWLWRRLGQGENASIASRSDAIHTFRQRLDDMVVCDLTIENTRASTDLWFRNARSGTVYDNSGDKSQVTHVVFGNIEKTLGKYGAGIRRKFVTNVAVPSKFIFQPVSNTASAISEMELNFQRPKMTVILKDIVLRR